MIFRLMPLIEVRALSPSCLIISVTGLALEFATHIFQQWLKERDINSIATTLKRIGLEGKLLVSLASSNLLVLEWLLR